MAPRVRIIPARAGQTPARPPSPSLCPDHPRACGANNALPDNPMSMYGSSPRVRGKPDQRRDPVRRERIIPARAGQTRWCREYRIPKPDHPRACGANLSTSSNSNSSAWIIPARAGQTCPHRWLSGRGPDHPRACGANKPMEMAEGCACGSSPRVRGKPDDVRESSRHLRIIPARAGQTSDRASRHGSTPDHPRACGANAYAEAHSKNHTGSSPRVRGKLELGRIVLQSRRIIPARAGQTKRPIWPKPRRTDHPRACGANQEVLVLRASFLGSSPRVRGKHDCQTSRRSGYRIIPARAGQTRRGVRVSSTSPDHPRACGANSCSLSRLSSTSGSSPRVRGKLRSRYRHAICYRIIPARAGQTLAGSEGGTTASDHPRACGANAIVIRRSDTPPGSSPRVRGKRYRP